MAPAFAHAKSNVPTPPRKPSVEKEGSFLGFMSLLDFGKVKPPVPQEIHYSVSPLTESDQALYRNIFELQEEGRMDDANRQIAKLSDNRLLGHVLYQRYMHPKAYKSNFDELKSWMDFYADQPGASDIYNMARKRQPRGFKGKLASPVRARQIARLREPTMSAGKTYQSPRARSQAELSRVQALRHDITALLKARRIDAALESLQKDDYAALLDKVEYDQILAQIASAALHGGAKDKALKLAVSAATRSGLYVPLAGWVAGLAEWQNGHYKSAAGYFEIAAKSSYASGWTSGAGAYWAARAHMRSGDVRQVSIWLKRAAEHPRTFYGLLATRALGQDFDFNWKIPTFTSEYYDFLAETPSGNRAMALVASGRLREGEKELFRMDVSDLRVREALLSYASYAGLPALAMRLGSAVSGPGGSSYDAALYPSVPWEPESGYKLDPALIYAIARQESRFDPAAESPSGARGLMQLMPKTASAIGGSKAFRDKTKLMDPQTNLELGQKYLARLLGESYIDDDLLSLLVAYNAGPGNLLRWKKNWRSVKDPLLFMELIPSSETRVYVEKVLANYWIYRLREETLPPSLEAMAQGKRPLYSQDTGPRSFSLASSR